MVFMHGRVLDFVTKKPLVNATVEMWEASTNGLYEQQDPEQVEHNLRGKFRTDEEGMYSYYCLRPTPYPVPGDGPAGKVLKLMDRQPFRPAHIHIIVCLRPSSMSVLCTNDRRPPTTATNLSPPRSSTARTRTWRTTRSSPSRTRWLWTLSLARVILKLDLSSNMISSWCRMRARLMGHDFYSLAL